MKKKDKKYIDNGSQAPAYLTQEVASTQTLVAGESKILVNDICAERKKGFRYGCYLFIKRSFDIISSGLVLIIFSWLYIILAIIVKCGDGGKVFYRQKRVGKGGKDTFITKFRSMKKDADDLEKHLTAEQIEQYHREFKVDNDPRITKFGKFLRKTSLDEIPQIWDIFRGRLSVVGPRPVVREEIEEKYGENAQKLRGECHDD